MKIAGVRGRRSISFRNVAMSLLLIAGAAVQVFGQTEDLAVVSTDASEVSPASLLFRRQATRRMIFDRSQEIPLSGLEPSNIVGIDIMHPLVGVQSGQVEYRIEGRAMVVSAVAGSDVIDSVSSRWIGAFNPFATYEVELDAVDGSGEFGLRFVDSESLSHLAAYVKTIGGKYEAIEWAVVKDGEEVDRQQYKWPSGVPCPFGRRA